MLRSDASVIHLLVIILISCFAVVGCGTSSKENPSVARQVPDLPEGWTAKDAVGAVQVGWIDSFNDAQMTQLVREAQDNNKNLQATAASVERNWALVRQAGAALKPSVNLTAGATDAGTLEGPSSGNMNVGVQVDWELDLWGRLRSGQQASLASAQAAEADYRYAQHSLAAAVARAYITAIEAQLQKGIAEDNVKAITETQRIVKIRRDNGMGSAQDLALAESDLASARDQLIAVEGSERDAIRALELLLGRYPKAELEVSQALPVVPSPPPAGLPSALLERRPDMVAAERRVASAFNLLDQAKAAKLPTLGITGSLGGTSNSLSSLLDPANTAWRLGTSLLAPLFDGGARQAQVDAATADQKQALAAYGQAALDAFSEVENNLDQGVVLDRRLIQLTKAEKDARKAYRLTELRYKEGESDLLDVLTVQQRVNASASNLMSVQRALLTQRINLNLALGGGWDTEASR